MAKAVTKERRRRAVLPAWASENAQDERRALILSEAAGCFNRQGYHGTTIDDIAERVNVTKAALYYYFTNKEEILFECHRTALNLGDEALRLAETLEGGADEKLEVALRYYIEGVAGKLQGTVVLLDEGILSGEKYKQILDRRDAFERRFRALVQRGVTDGIFEPRDSKLVVFAILGSCNWISKWYSPEGGASPSEIAAFFADYLVSGLRQRKPRRAKRKGR